ncbi:MAG TPA: organomercurial lyase, partial [Gammaproteobacteria bacterium]
MDAHARDGLERLTAIIPLAARQRALPDAWRAAHRAILADWAASGHPPARETLAALPGIDDVDALLARLASDDMLVLDADGEIAGAYPFSGEATPHRVALGEVRVHAMCAVDALAMAPLLGTHAQVDSACAASGRAV